MPKQKKGDFVVHEKENSYKVQDELSPGHLGTMRSCVVSPKKEPDKRMKQINQIWKRATEDI